MSKWQDKYSNTCNDECSFYWKSDIVKSDEISEDDMYQNLFNNIHKSYINLY